MLRTATILATLALGFMPSRAMACASCGCGDPTLTVMGAEQPFTGRLRFSSQLRYRWDQLGGSDSAEIHEVQLTVSGAWAPADWVMLSVAMPLVFRDVQWANLGHASVLGPGDADIRGRFVLLRDRTFAPSHMLGVTAGVLLPTSVDQHAPDGTLLPYEAQTGMGAVAPLAGVYYQHFADPWSVFASATVTLPFAPRYSEAPGPSLLGSLALQYRFDTMFTLRGAVDARFDAPGTEDGVMDPQSEELTLFLSPDLLWSPATDVTVVMGVRVPVVQVSESGRSEGVYFLVSLVLDANT